MASRRAAFSGNTSLIATVSSIMCLPQAYVCGTVIWYAQLQIW